ncbi:MAG: bifunctional UDP-N-acetylglucosamine diphosphorylase/glucosamine-1-phosphate N-acetyltransferase GlmU, partial [Gammaproteobacteria bacterium]
MATSPLSVIILAAGKGQRMYSGFPKVLHQVGGMPLLEHVMRTASRLNAAEIIVVHGNGGNQVHEAMTHWPITWIKQEQQLGTGHAVLQAVDKIPANHQILILYGDTPLISLETLQQLLQNAPPHGIALLTAQFADPTGYGRIIRDAQQHVIAIIEQRDASLEEQRIQEINTGILTAPAKYLQKWLPKLKPHNQQAEYYLTDIIEMAVADGCPIKSVTAQCVAEVQGINDPLQLATVERHYQALQAKKIMLQGVTLLDPQRFDLRGELHAEQDVVIDVNVIIVGQVFLGANCRVGANTVLRNVRAGANVVFKENCVVEDAEISEGCIIGPFARIRPGTHLASNVHIGNFVELKKSTLGENSKAGHLAYLGDAIIGKNVNVGAGTITCNYDGVNKNPTIIQDGAFIGSDVMLVAPVTVGENATIGAGSTISRDAPA